MIEGRAPDLAVVKAIRQDERHKVYDELGVLYGEDAKRFNEYLNSPQEEKTPEQKEMDRRVIELAKTIRLDPPEKYQQERDKVLDKFKEVIRLHDEDELLYPDLYNEFLVIYKSLRTTPEEP